MLNKLKSTRAAKMYAMEQLSKKLDRSEFEEPHDILAFEQVKDDIAHLDEQIRKADQAEQRPMLAQPIPYDHDATSVARPRRNLSTRNFETDDAAIVSAKFIGAVLGHEGSRQWLRSRGKLTKAQIEGTNAAGGATVPDDFLASIINLKEQYGIASRYCQKIRMSRDSMNWPRRTGGVTASFNIGEGGAIPESTAVWDNINLVAKKMACLIRLSTELSEDAMVNVADYLVSEIAYSFSSREDDCLFLGDGTSTYGGMVGLKQAFATATAGVYTATGHTTFDALTVADVSLWMGLLPQYALPGARFYCSQSFFSTVFRRLAAAAGGNTIQTLSGDLSYAWAGKPIVISQKLPAQTASNSGQIVAYYGDLSKAVAFGDRRQVMVKRSDERYFDTDQIGIMGTERFDIVVHDVGTSTVAGPLIALKMG
jgi:HK97 family phage major capsid protein